MGYNRITIVGNLGQKPELLYTNSAVAVTNLSVATTLKYSQNGNKKERTDWHRVVVFGKRAESCAEHLDKGRQILVEGQMQYRAYEDKDGNKKQIAEIIAKNIQLLGSPNRTSEHTGASCQRCPFSL